MSYRWENERKPSTGRAILGGLFAVAILYFTVRMFIPALTTIAKAVIQ